MKYQVLDNGCPADVIGFPQLKGCGWKSSTFDTLEEAQNYALNWLAWEPLEEGETFPFPVNQDYDYSGYGDCIRIQEVP